MNYNGNSSSQRPRDPREKSDFYQNQGSRFDPDNELHESYEGQNRAFDRMISDYNEDLNNDFTTDTRDTSITSLRFSENPHQSFQTRKVHIGARNHFLPQESSSKNNFKRTFSPCEYDNAYRETSNSSQRFSSHLVQCFESPNMPVGAPNQFSQEFHRDSGNCMKERMFPSCEYANTYKETNNSPQFADNPKQFFKGLNMPIAAQNEFSEDFHEHKQYVKLEMSARCKYNDTFIETLNNSSPFSDNPNEYTPVNAQNHFAHLELSKDSENCVKGKMLKVEYEDARRANSNTSQSDDKESYFQKLPYRVRRMEKRQSKRDYKKGFVDPSNEKREIILDASRNITNEMKEVQTFKICCKQNQLQLIKIITYLNQCRMREIAERSDSVSVKQLLDEYRMLHPASLDRTVVYAISNGLYAPTKEIDTKAITCKEWESLLTGQFKKLFEKVSRKSSRKLKVVVRP